MEPGRKQARRERRLVVLLVGLALLLATSWLWRTNRPQQKTHPIPASPWPGRVGASRATRRPSEIASEHQLRVPSEHQLRVLEGHDGPVESVAVGPDGLLVASASHDGTVKLWNPATGEVHGTLDGRAGPVLAVAFSPDGTMLASMSRAETEVNIRPRIKTVKLWDVATGRLRRSLEVSPEQRDRELETTPAGLLRPRQYHGDTYSLAFSPDGSLLASSGECYSARLWDVATGRLRRTLQGDRLLSDDADPRRPSPRRPLSVSGTGGNLSSYGPGGMEGEPGESPSYQFPPPMNEYGESKAGQGTVVAFDGSVLESPAPGTAHQDDVCSVTFSPDGATLATTSWDMTAGLWDVATGERRRVLQAHVGEVWSVAFSPDGARLATAGGDHAVKIWDGATGQAWRTLRKHTDRVRSVAFSPDGTRLASASDDGTVKLWDANSGCLQADLPGHEGRVRSVAFSPDGLSVYSAGWDNTVRVWKCPELEPPRPRPELSVTTPPASEASSPRRELGTDEVARFEGHEVEVLDVRFILHGGQILSAAADQTVRLWDLEKRAEVRRFVGYAGPVESVDVSPDGQWFAAGDGTGALVLQKLDSGQVVRRFESHAGHIRAVRFFTDGRHLASGSEDGTVKTWNLASGGQPHSFPCEGPVQSIACPRRGYLVMAAVAKANVVHVWYPIPTRDGNRPEATYKGHSETVRGCAFFGDFKRIFAFSTCGQEGPNGRDFLIRMWDARTGFLDVREFMGHTARPWGVDCSPDNSLLVSGGADRTVRLWGIESGREVHRFEGHTGPVRPVTFSPDGRLVASGSADRTVRVWQIPGRSHELAAKGAPGAWRVPPGAVAILTFEDETVVQGQSISLLPDRRTVLVASGSDRFRFWIVLTGRRWRGVGFPSAVCVFNRAPNATKGVITECLCPAGGQMSATPRVPHLLERAVLVDLAAGEVARTLGGWFRPPGGPSSRKQTRAGAMARPNETATDVAVLLGRAIRSSGPLDVYRPAIGPRYPIQQNAPPTKARPGLVQPRPKLFERLFYLPRPYHHIAV
ncbi:MAG TPA: WD40 repeat domain-containing protein [Thermoguttaceae bacterium]|nr:WD40 repeat domain-containing protein [Thermoguttaceae bacterium]